MSDTPRSDAAAFGSGKPSCLAVPIETAQHLEMELQLCTSAVRFASTEIAAWRECAEKLADDLEGMCYPSQTRVSLAAFYKLKESAARLPNGATQQRGSSGWQPPKGAGGL